VFSWRKIYIYGLQSHNERPAERNIKICNKQINLIPINIGVSYIFLRVLIEKKYHKGAWFSDVKCFHLKADLKDIQVVKFLWAPKFILVSKESTWLKCCNKATVHTSGTCYKLICKRWIFTMASDFWIMQKLGQVSSENIKLLLESYSHFAVRQ
jgi:hypothetical protein